MRAYHCSNVHRPNSVTANEGNSAFDVLLDRYPCGSFGGN